MAKFDYRCTEGHSWYVCSTHPDNPSSYYELRCTLCQVEHIFTSNDPYPFPKHPACCRGEHFWKIPCTCCYPGEFHCARVCDAIMPMTPENIAIYKRQVETQIEFF